MRPTWIEQPRNTRICGQIAVAVITGAPLKEVIRVIGHRKGTKSRELAHALTHFGYYAPERARRLSKPPPLAISQLRCEGRRGGNWHWVAIVDDIVYDGVYADGPVPLDEYHLLNTWPSHKHLRITSYLPITAP